MSQTTTAQIRAHVQGRLGVITLTRPEALNALTRGMILDIHAQLRAWREDDSVALIVLRGEGRAFCAGGDIKAVWEQAGRGEHTGAFFWDEYILDHAIHHYPKPFISLLDGFVMGGGAGISILGSHRVATEATRFAMPETVIGFYPDAGGTFFLSRLDEDIARYLGVTGARIDGADCLHCGLATHYVPSAKLETLLDDMAQGSDFEAALTRHSAHPEASGLDANRDSIRRIFSLDRLDAIQVALAEDESPWGAQTRALMASACPSSMALTLMQLAEGRGKSLAETLMTEYRLSLRRTRSNDFQEGVRARLVDKSRPPSWSPLAEQEDLAALFAPLDEAELPLV